MTGSRPVGFGRRRIVIVYTSRDFMRPNMRVSLRLILLAGAAVGTAALWHLKSDNRPQQETTRGVREVRPVFRESTPEYFDTHPLEGLKGSPFGEGAGR